MLCEEIRIGDQRVSVHDEGDRAGFFHTFEDFRTGGTSSEGRKIHVFLPRNYAVSGRRYRVAYMNDGSTAFFEGGPANLSWNMAGTLSELYSRNIIDEVIVVAIYPLNRNREYTHVPWGGPDCCGLEDYSTYIAEHIKPFMDAHYPTLSAPELNLVIGSSHGGLAAFYMAIRRPDCFGVVAALSPSFWIGLDNRSQSAKALPTRGATLRQSELLRLLRPMLMDYNRRPRIYLEWGLVRAGGPHNAEIEEHATARGREMADILVKDFGYEIGRDLSIEEDPRGEHNEITWGRHIPRVLEFFFAV